MNLDFLKQENWPKLGSSSHSQTKLKTFTHSFFRAFERVKKLLDLQKSLLNRNRRTTRQRLLKFLISFKWSQRHVRNGTIIQFDFLFKKSDIILNIDWHQCFENKNVQDMFDEFIFYTEVACNKFTPVKTLFNSSKTKLKISDQK